MVPSLYSIRVPVSSLVWLGGQIPIANRRYNQSSDHVVHIDYGLLNRCRIRSVGYIQFCGNELVGQYHKPVALRRTIQDLKQL